ncbi:CGNR zinc finger domain-containing protein [Streptomyces mirabilis]
MFLRWFGPGQLDIGRSADELAVADGMAKKASAARTAALAAEHADGAAAALNRLLQEHTGPLRLSSHGGSTHWHPHLGHDINAPWGEWLFASSCMALTVLVWDRQRPPDRICASPTCHNAFIAQGGGPERRYCSRRCATRERVAAHRRSHSAEQPSEIK